MKYKAIKNFLGKQGMVLKGQLVEDPTKGQIDRFLVEVIKEKKKKKAKKD